MGSACETAWRLRRGLRAYASPSAFYDGRGEESAPTVGEFPREVCSIVDSALTVRSRRGDVYHLEITS